MQRHHGSRAGADRPVVHAAVQSSAVNSQIAALHAPAVGHLSPEVLSSPAAISPRTSGSASRSVTVTRQDPSAGSIVRARAGPVDTSAENN